MAGGSIAINSAINSVENRRAGAGSYGNMPQNLWRFGESGYPRAGNGYIDSLIEQMYNEDEPDHFETPAPPEEIPATDAEIIDREWGGGEAHATKDSNIDLKNVFGEGLVKTETVRANALALKGKGAEDVVAVLEQLGYQMRIEKSIKKDSKAKIIKVENLGINDGRNISQIQISPGGKRHGENPYVKISTSDQGIIKIVFGDPKTYKSDGKEKAIIILRRVSYMIDIYAPIIPYVGAGGLLLGLAKERVEQELIKRNFSSEIYENDVLLYTDGKTLELCFSLPENLLCRITVLSGYKGRLFEKIEMGMPEDEIQRIEPTFVYDEFREVYETPKGAIIETDLPEHTVAWISVFQTNRDG